jgi:hypothetical protein
MYWEDEDRDRLRMFMAERFDDYQDEEMTYDEYREDKRERRERERDELRQEDEDLHAAIFESKKTAKAEKLETIPEELTPQQVKAKARTPRRKQDGSKS